MPTKNEIGRCAIVRDIEITRPFNSFPLVPRERDFAPLFGCFLSGAALSLN